MSQVSFSWSVGRQRYFWHTTHHCCSSCKKDGYVFIPSSHWIKATYADDAYQQPVRRHRNEKTYYNYVYS